MLHSYSIPWTAESVRQKSVCQVGMGVYHMPVVCAPALCCNYIPHAVMAILQTHTQTEMFGRLSASVSFIVDQQERQVHTVCLKLPHCFVANI